MQFRFTPLLVALGLLTGMGAHAQSTQWRANVYGPNNSEMNLGHFCDTCKTAAGMDDARNLFVTGTVAGTGGTQAHSDWKIVKLNAADGSVMWQKTLNGSDLRPGDDYPTAMAVDAQGHAIVMGIVWDGTEIETKVVKYDGANGNILWQVQFNNNGQALGLDAAGNILATHGNAYHTTLGWGVVKLSGATGATIWHKRLTPEPDKINFPVGLGVDPNGSAVATMWRYEGGLGFQWTTVKFAAADGTPQWTKVENVGNNEDANIVNASMDGEGNQIVSGLKWTGTVYQLETIKYANADGSVMWRAAMPLTMGGGLGIGIASDTFGNTAISYASSVYRFMPTGDVAWVRPFTAGAGNVHDVAFDMEGNVIATGSMGDAENFDARTIKLSNYDGSLLWQHRYAGAPGSYDRGAGIITRTTSLYVVGQSREEGMPNGVLALKLSNGIAPVLRAALSDFNGDGRSDLAWYHAPSGTFYSMYMDGLAPMTGEVLDVQSDTNWRVEAIADLNGDGKADTVWRHSTTGQVYGRLSGVQGGGSGVFYTEPNASWRIVGAGDFSGDGQADLLWHNAATGDVFMMLMNGLMPTFGAVIYSEPNAAWAIQKVADFNGDGRADIVWRNAATGDVYMMLMDGTTVLGGSVIYSEPSAAWTIQSAADYDGDGKADLLWRNTATGDLYMMLMNGTTVAGGSVFYSEPNGAWQIVANGDYNADGKADIVWRHGATGQVYMMLMNGATVLQGAFVYTEPDQNWRIVQR